MRALFLLTGLFLCSIMASSQINVKQKAKDKTIQRGDQRTDEAIDKGLDKIENGVKSLFKKKDKNKNNEVANDSTGTSSSSSSSEVNNGSTEEINNPVNKDQTPTLATYSKYDFVPGEKVIFYEDFSQDAIGDFPALWNTDGSAEVVTTNLYPGNWMKFITHDNIWTDKLLVLPENYTIEFDVIPIKGEDNHMLGYSFLLTQAINKNVADGGSIPGKAGFYLTCAYYGELSYRAYTNETDGVDISGSKDGEQYKEKVDQKYHIAIWVQKSRVRVYQGEDKIFDLPKAFPSATVKMDRLRFEEGAAMLSNIRIAVGAPDTRNKLLTEGKLVTYGICFDVNKDVVKPESYGTLKEIANVLKENPDVKVKIVGHTDSDGADAANLDLSKRRAASVKDELVKTFGIDAARMETDGKGETEPLAANDTPANKAQNRRVEFIKL
jgi:OmpA-OmpF porin, OOP family